MPLRLLVLALCLFSWGAHAQVFKCKGPGGKLVYSDAPCADGTAGTIVNTQANVLETDATRAAERAPADDMVPMPVRPLPPGYRPQAMAPALPQESQRIDPQACNNAKRDLDYARGTVSLEQSRGKHPGAALSALRAAESRVDVACGTKTAADRSAQPTGRNASSATQDAQPQTSVLTHCDSAQCIDNYGVAYTRAGGTTLINTRSGAVCNTAGKTVLCP